MNNKKAQLINGYWVVETNKWDANIYTKEQAEKYADTLINCTNCVNCNNCRNSSYCINCSDCIDSSYCSFCSSSISCSFCSFCHDCHDSSFCRNCSFSSYCIDCCFCSSSSYCINCSYCHGFKENPERITSPKIGSRNGHTTYYWTKDHEQIVCGCFIGTLEDFEKAVEKTHGNNQQAHDYLKWIERVKIYLQGGNK
jgi:hypothetical protein